MAILVWLALVLAISTGVTVGFLDTGFRNAFELDVTGDNACGFSTPNATGTVNVSIKTNCTWIISRNNASLLTTTLRFEVFNLDTMDYLIVYDGVVDVNRTREIAHVTGQKEEFLAVSFSNKTIVVLMKKSNVKANLVFHYDETECQVALHSWTSKVDSPLYLPGQGPIQCEYDLKAFKSNPGQILAMSFSSFNLPNGYLTIFNKTGVTHNFTGNSLPDDVFASSLSLSFKLILHNSSIMQDFTGIFMPVDSECTQYIDASLAGQIVATIPLEHNPLVDCRWILKAKPGNTLFLEVTDLQLQVGADRLIINDGGSQGSRLITELDSVTATGTIIVSSGERLWLRLIGGELPAVRHLSINFTEQANGGRFYNSGNITLMPQQNSTSPALYYQFQVPEEQQVKITIVDDLMHPAASLDFYDGSQLSSPLLTSFNTETNFYPVTASGGLLLMVARNFDKKQFLNASFEGVSETCDAIAIGNKGDYMLKPTPVPKEACRWIIPPKKSGGTIIFSLKKLSLLVNQTLSVFSGTRAFRKTLTAYGQNKVYKFLPDVSIPASKGAEMLLLSTNKCKTNCSSPVTSASFVINPDECGGRITSSKGVLTSPNYPNYYPINSQCMWKIPNKSDTKNKTPGKLYITFISFSLTQKHYLALGKMVNGTSRNMTVYKGMKRPADNIITKPDLTLTFSAPPAENPEKNTVAQGFSLSYTQLSCGGKWTKNMGKFSSPPKPAPMTKCVWIVSLPPKGKNSTVNIVEFNVSFTGSLPKSRHPLKFHDGPSVWDPVLVVNLSKSGKTGPILTRRNALFVTFTNGNMSAEDTNLVFTIKYSMYICDKSQQCKNGICLHPDWHCNGVDNCGDMTDEMNCTTPGTGSSSGVKSYWIPICLILGLGFGILLVIVVPAIYRRIRYPNYGELRDLSAPVST